MMDVSNKNGGEGSPHGAMLTFPNRLKTLYLHWEEHKDDMWGSADVFSIATPPPSDSQPRYLKSSSLTIWLLGYEFPETIMVFGKKQIHILCSKEKANSLKVLIPSAKVAVGVDVIIHEKPESDDCTAQMDVVLNAIRSQEKSKGDSGPTVGHIVRETGKWDDKLKSSGLPLCDVTNGFSDLFAVKDLEATEFIEKSAYKTASVMEKSVVPYLKLLIDQGKTVSHCSLMEHAETAMVEPENDKRESGDLGVCYPPIFQSGGNFDLNSYALSTKDDQFYDMTTSTSVIISALGSRYKGYCSNIARTILIDADTIQRKAYEVLLKAQEAAIGALHPGIRASAVYEAAVAVVQRDAPELIPNLTESAGTGIGLEFRELALLLNSKNDRVLKAGMVFNVSLGMQNLQSNSKFALLLADTVIITDAGHEVVTQTSSKSFRDVHIARRRTSMKNNSEIVAYKNMDDFPSERGLKIQVDEKHKAVLLPIDGRMVPFHVSTVKTVSCLQDGRNCYVRIIFNEPGPEDAFQSAISVKEATFRSEDPRHASEIVKQIKELVSKDKLVLAGDAVKLDDLWISPVFGGRGRKPVRGTLEAHVNGFRFMTGRNEWVDVMYGDIKHAFVLLASGEVKLTLVHFHLHKHIMVGKKKTKEVQFYFAYGSNEIESDRKNKINNDFKDFVKGVHDIWRQQGVGLEFDQLVREIVGFHGINESSVFVETSNCLVDLIATELVISLGEIEIVNLERVGPGQVDFDMVVVYKDLKKPVTQIESVPSSVLDEIKGWLNLKGIKYYESGLNLSWPTILKGITDDPLGFLDEGGWEFLNWQNRMLSHPISYQGHEPSDTEPDDENG